MRYRGGMGSPSDRAVPDRNSYRAQVRHETRERFLDAAQRVFEDIGYSAASVQDILQASGGGRATFYTHFASKADVAGCLFERLLPASRRRYQQLADTPVLTHRIMREWLEEGIAFFVRNRSIVNAVNCAIAEDGDVAERHYTWITEAVACLSGAPGPGYFQEAQLRATALVMQWERFCTHWIVRGVRVTEDVGLVLDVFADIWCRELDVISKGLAAT